MGCVVEMGAKKLTPLALPLEGYVWSHTFSLPVSLSYDVLSGVLVSKLALHYHAAMRLAIKKCDFDENLWALAFLLDLFAPCGIM